MQASDRKRPSTARRRVLVALLVAVSATLSISLSGVALADRGGERHDRSADVTFTKWIVTAPPSSTTNAGAVMAGVVGGDVGRGRYAGLVINDDTVSRPGYWLGHARYEFHGREHTFVADMHIMENDMTVPITATLLGVVTSGWLRGAHLTGQYTQFDTCPIPTPGNVFGSTCYQGTLHLQSDHHRR